MTDTKTESFTKVSSKVAREMAKALARLLLADLSTRVSGSAVYTMVWALSTIVTAANRRKHSGKTGSKSFKLEFESIVSS